MMEKDISLMIQDNKVLVKCKDIWNKIREILIIEFHSNLVYHWKYIKTKVQTFKSVFYTIF